MRHQFTSIIDGVLKKHFAEIGQVIYENSQLLQYLNQKTRSANKGSKARSSFANLYAIYVLVEDYVSHGFNEEGDYSKYDGAEFNKLFARQRQLPFGAKLQNHALNNRMNSEFEKYFPSTEYIPISRDLANNRYWINENLLKITVNGNVYNIAPAVIDVINAYAEAKKSAFERFVQSCLELQTIPEKDIDRVETFVLSLIKPEVDARLFEIVSYSILKYFYRDITIFWGFEKNKLNEEKLVLFKTGRTNANDGGIDFVMKPLGRFFQVTETLDVKKYFLDIDKIQRYPITFVVKSEASENELMSGIRQNAIKMYSVEAVVNQYMCCIEEIINIHKLRDYLRKVIECGYLENVLNEIIVQSKVEFNYHEVDDENQRGVENS